MLRAVLRKRRQEGQPTRFGASPRPSIAAIKSWSKPGQRSNADHRILVKSTSRYQARETTSQYQAHGFLSCSSQRGHVSSAHCRARGGSYLQRQPFVLRPHYKERSLPPGTARTEVGSGHCSAQAARWWEARALLSPISIVRSLEPPWQLLEDFCSVAHVFRVELCDLFW